ncbi:2-oxo acid dehydrogenase subunit E2 [Ruminococcaceae bacterium OttesenSCG-928-I18]|nr:2-oxo acid dehydrogenase subunit E2 [Ruminococcaceae bacterium OttesenSCG-928-I18]
MAKLITIPKMGLTMTEGTVTEWFKQEGDSVEAGEPLYSIETNKANTEIQSPIAGIVRKIFAQEGETLPIKGAVAIVADANEDIAELMSTAAQGPKDEGTQPSPDAPETDQKDLKEPATPVVKASKGRVAASPLAKKLAAKHGIDLATIAPAGETGRITVADVENHLAKQADKPSDLVPSGTAEVADAEEVVPLSTLRKRIAERLTQSWLAAPTYTHNMTVDVSALQDFKESISKVHKVTYTTVLIKLVACALMDCPLLNCSLVGENLIYKKYVNMGIATSVEGGLLVPVIKNAHSKGIRQISEELAELSAKARAGKLELDDMSGGTFTISNMGKDGIDSKTSILNPGEVGLLGVNTTREELYLDDGIVKTRPVMTLSATADHRVVDGAELDVFLIRLRDYIQNPSQIAL